MFYSFTILFLWNVNDSQTKIVIGDGLFMILSISKKNLQKTNYLILINVLHDSFCFNEEEVSPKAV